MRTTITRGLAALALAGTATLGLGAPGHAADTTTTFMLTGGGLAISAPLSADLGSATTGASSIQGRLGPVTVTDSRGRLAATWTATASATDFTTGGGTAAETVPRANLIYTPGLPTASSPSTGVFAPTAGALGLPLPVYTGAATGNNSAAWDPTLTITLPSQAVAGSYAGTVTHSVS